MQEDRRGRPVCRPVSGSRAEVCPGGHIGPPLHGVEGIPNQRKIGAKTDLANGAGQSPPLLTALAAGADRNAHLFIHPIVLERMIRILREGRAQTTEEDLKALTVDVQVE